MASSLRKAQSILSCQLCDSAVVLRWKCEDCQLLMCEKCKTIIHPRFKSANKHSVILIKDVGKENKAVVGKDIDVSGMFASLEIFQCQEVKKQVIGSILNTYTTNLRGIFKLLCFDDDKVYYFENKGNTIVKAKLLRASIKILQVSERKIFDLTMNSDGELLTALIDNGSELKVLLDDSVMKTVCDISPMKILGQHYNKNSNELFIGARDSGAPFHVTQYSTRPVIILGSGYNRKDTIEFSTEGKRLFTYPARIVVDINGIIYVIDIYSGDWIGRIVAVAGDCHMKYTYSGYDDFNTSEFPFRPTDIAVTQSNNLVISDHNDALHILQTDGQLIGFQKTQEVGITSPYSLCVDSEGFLLIGCSTHDDDPDDAKIHVVKLSI